VSVGDRLTFSLANPLLPDKPADDPEAVGDPYKTLFISRLVIHLACLDLTRTRTDLSPF